MRTLMIFLLVTIFLILTLIYGRHFTNDKNSSSQLQNSLNAEKASTAKVADDTLLRIKLRLSYDFEYQENATAFWLKQDFEVLEGQKLITIILDNQRATNVWSEIESELLQAGFTEVLSQAAGGPSGSQSGYVNNDLNQRCLLSESNKFSTYDVETRVVQSTTYELFCEE